MFTKKQLVTFVIITLLGLFILNQFVFGMSWVCRCYNSIEAWGVCMDNCNGECEGHRPYGNLGVCMLYTCWFQTEYLCTNSTTFKYDVVIYPGCSDCMGGF